MCPSGKCRLRVLRYTARGFIYTWVNTHTYYTYTLTVHAYADGYKKTHTHTQAVIDPSERSKMDVLYRVYD